MHTREILRANFLMFCVGAPMAYTEGTAVGCWYPCVREYGRIYGVQSGQDDLVELEN